MKFAEPKFLKLKGDPYHRKPRTTNNIKEVTKGSRKRLTKISISSILKVPLIERTTKMGNSKNTNNKGKATTVIKSVAWLLEAAFRGFIGWLLLAKFNNVVTTAAAFYALGTAAVIVVTHFIKANK